MPHVVNGIGTWYYGKDNAHTTWGVCDSCRSVVDMKSYDTTKYFVIFFVPFFPLGSYRVLEECSRCKKHRLLKQKEWTRLKAESVREVLAELREDHTNEETVIKALETAVAFQDREIFAKVGDTIAAPMVDNHQVQAVLGRANEYFGKYDRAETAFRQSLRVKEDPAVREQLALLLMRTQRPAEAAPLLEHIAAGAESPNVWLLLVLAETYQAQGNHTAALSVLARCEEIQPDLENDKTYRKQKQFSEKNRETSKPLKSDFLNVGQTQSEQSHDMGGFMARWTWRFVVAGLFMLYLGLCLYFGESREVHVVNGLDSGYSVAIGDQLVTLTPKGKQVIRLSEGSLPVRLHEDGQPRDWKLPETVVDIHTSFLLRPFQSHTFIINPDRVALVTYEENFYAENPNDASQPVFEVSVGEPLYHFTGIDHVFEQFPQQIRVSESSSAVKRTRVATLSNSQIPEVFFVPFLTESVGEEICADYLRRLLQYQPDMQLQLAQLRGMLSHADFLSFIQTRLGDRPVRVEWHRAYQDVMELENPQHDLIGEYQKLLDAEPTNGNLAYLLGRVTLDPARFEQLMKQAMEADPPCPLAVSALAFDLLANGRFAEALPLAEQAYQENSEDYNASSTYERALAALGKTDELAALAKKAGPMSAIGIKAVQDQVCLLAVIGKQAEAEKVLNEYSQQGGEMKTLAEYLATNFRAQMVYALGDVAEYEKLSVNREHGAETFDTCFANKKWDKAAELITEDDEPSNCAIQNLLLYVAVSSEGHQEQAEKYLQAALPLLKQSAREYALVGEMLKDENGSNPERLASLAVFPYDKRVLLAAAGTRFPKDRAKYFSLAKRLNYDLTVPYHFLKSHLDK